MPDSEEIKKLQFGIKNFMDDSEQLITSIKKWQKEINQKILLLENNKKNNIVLNSVDFINNYNNSKITLYSIIKFRIIYSCVIEPESKNNKILSFLNEDNFINKQNKIFEYNDNNLNYEYKDYLAMKYLLKDINNYKDNFIKKSRKILEYLFNNQPLNNTNKTINKNIVKTGLNKAYLNNTNTNIRIKYNNNFKSREIQKDINNISNENKMNKSYDNFAIFKRLKKSKSEIDNESHHSLISSMNNVSINDTIYSKKKYISKISTLIKTDFMHTLNTMSKNNTLNYHSLKDINPKKLFSNTNYTYNSHNLQDEEKLNNFKSMADIQQINNTIKKKTYIHKKFILKKESHHQPNNKIVHKIIDKNRLIHKEKLIENRQINNQNNIFSNTDSKIDMKKSPLKYSNKRDFKSNNIIDIPISFKNKKHVNIGGIKSSIFDKCITPFQIEDENKNIEIGYVNTNSNQTSKHYSQKITNQIFFNPNNKVINKSFDINIIKPLKYEFIKINNDKNVYIGIDLGNIETKIGIIKNYNEIQLMNFSENNYSLPTMISFNNRNKEITIGSKTEELLVSNPSQTIFNIIKIFGHDYDEIINNNNQTHLLWPFKLYKDNYNKPYVKIKIKEEEKNYYFEQILILFLKKTFDLVFQKITIDNLNNTSKNDKNKQSILNLSLIVSIPNYFSYFQRKLLEKLFVSEIFPSNNSIYGGYHVILDKIGIENRSSMAGLCLKNSPKIKNNNILIINLDTCSVDISIISIFDNINKVIVVDSIELINENFTDNFINLCLKILKENNINIPKEFLYSDSLLSKLRKLSPNIIKSLVLKEEVIFIIDNLNNGNGNCIIKLNRIDYDKICYELCKNIIILIKNALIKAKLNENDINDIILIGEAINMNKLNQMIKELFINNKSIYDKISNSQNVNLNEENQNYYIVAGNALRAYNLNNQVSSYIFQNICPINLGIESYNGSMDFIIKKNSALPINFKKDIKIKNIFNDSIIINIYEGEEIIAKKNKLISQFIFDKTDFKYLKNSKNIYLDISTEFEIDNYLNIKFYINDNKTFEHLFKCEINIEKRER